MADPAPAEPHEGPLDFEHVRPLIAHTEIHTSSLYVTFRCPTTGVEVIGTARLDERTPIGGSVHGQGDWDRLRHALKHHVAPFPPEGGPPMRDPEFQHAVMRGELDVDDLSRGVYRHAVLRAFEGIRDHFVFRRDDDRWVGDAAA